MVTDRAVTMVTDRTPLDNSWSEDEASSDWMIFSVVLVMFLCDRRITESLYSGNINAKV